MYTSAREELDFFLFLYYIFFMANRRYAYSSSTLQDQKTYLAINNAGYDCLDKYDSIHRIRPTGRSDFQIIFVHSGHIAVYDNGKKNLLSPGDFVLYSPFERQDYIFLKNQPDPTVVLWMHFTGYAVHELLDDLGMNSFLFHTPLHDEVLTIWDDIIDQLVQMDRNYKTVSNYLLIKLFALLSNNCTQIRERSDRFGDIKNAVMDMRLNYAVNHTLDEYAEMCFMSKYTFLKKFKTRLKMSPIAYLNSIRLTNAAFLLTETNLSIEEISHQIGYTNAYYFSRIFKKKYGISPLAYRKANISPLSPTTEQTTL